MTLRFIVVRVLRELIELAEGDEDAELVAAMHDALDVAVPTGVAPALSRLGVGGHERCGAGPPDLPVLAARTDD